MNQNKNVSSQKIALCCLTMIIALWIVGVASGEILRHLIQTLPIWIGVIQGFRNSQWTKSAALPFFIFWLAIMTLIWLFLLRWSRIARGHYSPTEIAMTIVIGAAAFLGIVFCARMKTQIKFIQSAAIFVFTALAQYVAMYVSLLPQFRSR
jgi:cation transport ATPase